MLLDEIIHWTWLLNSFTDTRVRLPRLSWTRSSAFSRKIALVVLERHVKLLYTGSLMTCWRSCPTIMCHLKWRHDCRRWEHFSPWISSWGRRSTECRGYVVCLWVDRKAGCVDDLAGGCIGGRTVTILVERCGLVGWMVGHWWVSLLICLVIDKWYNWLISIVDWSIGWLDSWFYLLVCWLVDWLTCWLIDD